MGHVRHNHIWNLSTRDTDQNAREFFNEILLNFKRKRVKISITNECEFEIVKYANNMLAFRKDASPKSCSESKMLLKIVKLAQKLQSRICLGLVLAEKVKFGNKGNARKCNKK